MQLPSYDSVPASMMTLMVVPNFKIDIVKLFYSLNVVTVFPKINRSGNPIKRGLCGPGKNQVPHGSIYGASFGNLLKGTNLVSNKKEWCRCCKLYDRDDDGLKKRIYTLKKIFVKIKEYTHIMFFCDNCKKIFETKDPKTLSTFPTQLGIYFSINGRSIHAMIFKKKKDNVNKIKLAGCSSYMDAKIIMDILFNEYIKPKNLYQTKPSDFGVLIKGVLRNKRFKFPFSIDREKLVELFNRPEYVSIVQNINYEKSKNTSVLLSFYNLDSIVEVAAIDYGKKDPKMVIKRVETTEEKKPCSIMVFTSSDANPNSSVFIFSCNDYYSGNHVYDTFVKIVMDNRNFLEEIFE